MEDILSYPFFQRALLGALIIGFTNGCFSAYVVLRRSALVAGSLSHALLPGIAAGILVSGALTAWSAFLGAMIAALLVVLGSLAVARSSRLDQGTALAVIFTIAFAVGLILLKYVPVQVKLEDYLFGDILNISSSDLWVTFGISVFTLVLTTALQRPILLTLFEPSVAAAQGVPVRVLNYLIMTLLVLVMVSSLQAVGCILALGLVVAPGATVFLLTNSTRAMFWGGGVLGAAGAVGGMVLAHYGEFRPGATITVLLGAAFLLAFFFGPRSGFLRRAGSQ
ncbi:MAG: hypothetical protein JWM59_741 [Verrucomicrobiales bacterium]|nr:hypothetical protein [Verrucomicrobiales bacterium]